jgi:hypothetical protein
MHVGWWEGRANCTQMGYLNVRVPDVKCWYCVKHSCGCYLLLLFSCNSTVEWYILPVNYFNSIFCNTVLGFRCFSCCSFSKGYLMDPSMSVTFFCNSGTTYPFAVTHICATVDLRFLCWNRLLCSSGIQGFHLLQNSHLGSQCNNDLLAVVWRTTLECFCTPLSTPFQSC